MALAVPLSRFPPRVGGGSAFYVRPRYTFMKKYIVHTNAGHIIEFEADRHQATSKTSHWLVFYRGDKIVARINLTHIAAILEQ